MAKFEPKNPNDINQIVEGYFGGLPVVEAPADLILVPNDDDATGAVPDDPANCLYARCARRLLGGSEQIFFRTVAYVEMPTPDGPVVMRFKIPKAGQARVNIDALDRNGTPGPDAKSAVVLKAPKNYETLSTQRQQESASRGQPVRRPASVGPRDNLARVPRRGNFTVRTVGRSE